VLLLLTGASGVGKSTVRALVADRIAPAIHAVELRDVVPIPAAPDLAWRQRATEEVLQQAIALQADGRHLLLAGDPVAPGEVVAAPSFDRLDGFDACLLDAAPDAQRERLARRGDPPSLLDAYQAFADWFRHHIDDPAYRPEVLQSAGDPSMRWGRLATAAWAFTTIDTTNRTPDAVAADVLSWLAPYRSAAGQAIR
jgi:hypothetical protein